MGSDLVVLLILVVLVLSYASLLLSIRLGSLGAPRRQIRTIILELWVTFALVLGVFGLLQQVLGPVPKQTFPGDLFTQAGRIMQLPFWQQLAVYGGLIAVVALFVHLMRSLRNADRHTPTARRNDGDIDDPVS